MFSRVATFQGPPARLDELTRTFQERVLPAIRELDGYRGVYWLVDRRSGKAISVSLWENEEAVSASDVRGEQLRALSEPVGFTVQSVERYEVAVQG